MKNFSNIFVCALCPTRQGAFLFHPNNNCQLIFIKYSLIVDLFFHNVNRIYGRNIPQIMDFFAIAINNI